MENKQFIENCLTNNFGQNLKHPVKYTTKLSPEQLETLRAYKDWFESKPSRRGGLVKTTTVCNTLTCLYRLGQWLNKPYKPAEEDIPKYREDIIAWTKTMKNDRTRSVYKSIVTGFYKWMYKTKQREIPDIMDDIRLKPEVVKTPKKPTDLPTHAEIEAMFKACLDDRDRTLVLLWTEMGARGGEVASIKISDVTFDNKGAVLYLPKSKSEPRPVRVVKTAPYLKNYLDREHPDAKNPNAPLFVSKAFGGHWGNAILASGLTSAIKRIAQRAGIQKHIYWHLGRFYNSTDLINRKMPLPLVAKRQGITVKTLTSTYMQTSYKDVDDAFCRLNGVESEEDAAQEKKDSEMFKPIKCPRCGHSNPCGNSFCEVENCRTPLDLFIAIRRDEELEIKNKQTETRLAEMEAMLKQVAQNLQQPTMIQQGDNQAMISVSGCQPFGQKFKPWGETQ